MKGYSGWGRIYETENLMSGEKTVRYSHTPAQFVQELQEREEYLLVAKRCCRECFLTPDCSISSPLVQEIKQNCAELGRFPECICYTVAHHLQRTDPHGTCVCFAYYYLHCQDSPYLTAISEAGLVRFVDTAAYPSLRETGLIAMSFT